MQEKNFKTFIDEVRENFKISIDDLFNAIEIIREDIEEIKTDLKNH